MNWSIRYAMERIYPEDVAEKTDHTYEPDASHTTWKLHEPVGKIHGVKVTQTVMPSVHPESVRMTTTYLDKDGNAVSEGPQGWEFAPVARGLQYADMGTGNHEETLISAVKALHA